MKKTIRIEGLDCGNCAAKIERGIADLDGVTKCQVSFLTGKIALETDDDKWDDIMEKSKKIVRKVEPGAKLVV